MMNKILITVVVPSIEEKYDIYIPISKTIQVTKKLLIKIVNELSNGHFPLKEDCVIMSDTGVVYENKLTIKECGLKNADKVILI